MNLFEKLYTLIIFLAVIIGLGIGQVEPIALSLVIGPLLELPILAVVSQILLFLSKKA